jgi:diketogulonate reductase-like aldo/keto reductase
MPMDPKEQPTVDVRGVRIPKLGFGTWRLTGSEARKATETALSLGYRHVDTAEMYDNEAMVGAAIRASGIPRDELWVTSKIWMDHAAPRDVHAATRNILKRLAMDRVDLLLLHWPNPEVPLGDTLSAMTEVLDQGLARRIGVSNFTPSLLREALALAPVAAVQVEYHPYLAQDELRQICQERGLAFTSYAPLGRGEVLEDGLVQAIADRHGASPAQIVLAWHLAQPNVGAVPKARSEAHQAENLGAVDVALTAQEVDALHGLARGRRIVDPSFAPAWENPGVH